MTFMLWCSSLGYRQKLNSIELWTYYGCCVLCSGIVVKVTKSETMCLLYVSSLKIFKKEPCCSKHKFETGTLFWLVFCYLALFNKIFSFSSQWRKNDVSEFGTWVMFYMRCDVLLVLFCHISKQTNILLSCTSKFKFWWFLRLP